MAAAAEPTLTVEVIPGMQHATGPATNRPLLGRVLGQLYYCELLGTPSSDGSGRNFWFDMERFLFYISFSADFGPVNMAQTYRFYRDMLRITDVRANEAKGRGGKTEIKILMY